MDSKQGGGKARKSSAITLVLVPLLLAGCGESPETMQRDVYTKFEDCMADWGKPELCQQLQQADAQQFAQQTTGVQNGGGGSHVIFWGPSYYPGNRAISYGGSDYVPSSNRAMSRPFAITSTSSSLARTSPGVARSASVARGGLGGAHGVSSGG